MTNGVKGRHMFAVLGDSTCTNEGASDYPRGGQDFHPTRYGWLSQIQSAWPDSDWHVFARRGALVGDFLDGSPSANIRGAVKRVGALQPDTVLISLGGNEYLRGVYPDWFGEHLRTLADQVSAVCPARLVFLVPWHAHKGGLKSLALGRWEWDDYTRQIETIANEVGGHVIDLGRDLPPARIDNRHFFHENEYGVLGVSIHPTDIGHQRIYYTVNCGIPYVLEQERVRG